MLNRFPKPFIYDFVLVVVLGIGILIGKNGTNNIQQTADIGDSVKDNIAIINEDEEKKPDNSHGNVNQSIELPSINSTHSVKVIRVLDGDTIEVEGGERVRYLGINAPESGQPFSTEATRENER